VDVGRAPAELDAEPWWERSRIARFIAAQHTVIALLFIAAAVRLVVLAVHAGSPIDMDGAEYVRIGHNLASGAGMVGMRGFPTVQFAPLFPLLIAALTFPCRAAAHA
jgi:hypothetical protein